MSTQMVSPLHAQRLDIRCNVVDIVLSNVANHLVFLFERQLDTRGLADAFAHALTNLPIFAGRMTLVGGALRIRCTGQGVPFTSASSDRTLHEAIRSVTEDRGDWLIDPVNGATARWGFGPLCKVRVTHLADDATAIGFSWHHATGDMQTAMFFMNAWAAAAANKPLPEPVIVEDRAAYLDEHLPADGAREPGVRCLGLAETARCLLYLAKDGRKQRTLSLYFGDDEITRMRDAYENQMRLSVKRRCVRACFRGPRERQSRGGSSHPRHLGEYAESVWPGSDARRKYPLGVERRHTARRDGTFDCRTHPPQDGPLRRRILRHAHQPTVPGHGR
jgi:hypothetical protein